MTEASSINRLMERQIAEMLASVQYQDIVRQMIDRLEQAQADKTTLFADIANRLILRESEIEMGGQTIASILSQFMDRERSHVRPAGQSGLMSPAKVELF
jgi:ribosomal 50S subunit-associated protein YjgA (DUF615 family)